MRALNDVVIRFSKSAGLFVLAFVVAIGSLQFVFFPINVAFAELTGGLQPFDFQNDLTVEQIFQQLPQYTDAVVNLYVAFAFVDYFFPFFASVFLGALACFSLRHLSTTAYGWANQRCLFVLFFLPAVFDWFENCFALTVIFSYPNELTTVAGLLVIAKKGKLACVAISQIVAWTLLVLAALRWLGRKVGLVRA